MTTPDFSSGVAYVRGEYLPISQASIPMTDWGFLRSDATYDVVTVWEGSFFRLEAHLERFLREDPYAKAHGGRLYKPRFGRVPGLPGPIRLRGVHKAYRSHLDLEGLSREVQEAQQNTRMEHLQALKNTSMKSACHK